MKLKLLKIGEQAKPADVVVLTTGILAGNERQATSEGIEMDMAVSYLSRLVILKYLVPRLSPKSRVFVMGFPGSNQPGINVDDLNAEQSYKGGMGFVHLNTVAGNEALVLDWAKKDTPVRFYGLNPGLIKTGIRGNLYESGIMKFLGTNVIEPLVGLFMPTPESYASKMVSLLFAPNLEDKSGAMFNPKAQAVLPSIMFTKDDGALADKFIRGSEKLVQDKAGIQLPK